MTVPDYIMSLLENWSSPYHYAYFNNSETLFLLYSLKTSTLVQCFIVCLIIIKNLNFWIIKKRCFLKKYLFILFFHVIINGDSLCTYKVFYM